MNATRKKKVSAPAAEKVSSASVASVKQEAVKAPVAQETVIPHKELACKKIKFVKPTSSKSK